MVKQMIKVQWELEEAVALFDIYFKNGGSLNISEDILGNMTEMYIKRAKFNPNSSVLIRLSVFLSVCILILSILVYTFFSRMFDLMLPPVAKHSIVVA